MHTDEYEISITKEIGVCRRFVKQLERALEKREQRHGMTTESFMQAYEEGRPENVEDLDGWSKDYRELQYWSKMLRDYEEALRIAKQL